MPVSGMKKQYTTLIDQNGNMLDALLYNIKTIYILNKNIINYYTVFPNIHPLILFFITLFLTLLFLFLFRKVLKKIYSIDVVKILIFSTIFHAMYHLLVGVELTVNWYQYFIYITIFLIAAIYSSFLFNANKGFSISIFMTILLLCILQFRVISNFPRKNLDALMELVKFVNNYYPKDRFFLYDPGKFILLTRTNTFAGNALASDYHSMTMIVNKKQLELCSEYKIKYFIEYYTDTKINEIIDKGVKIVYKTQTSFTDTGTSVLSRK